MKKSIQLHTPLPKGYYIHYSRSCMFTCYYQEEQLDSFWSIRSAIQFIRQHAVENNRT